MTTSIERYLWMAAVVVIVAGFFLYRHSLIVDGEQICQQREKAAADKQAIQDSKIAQDTVDELQREIARLRSGSVVAPANPTRVQCYARKVPAPKGVTGTAQPGEPATPGESVPEVSGGTGSGGDLGPSLQRFALACDVVSARDRACLSELKAMTK
jgi:hypothetical protein